jgi:hypothetical protein
MIGIREFAWNLEKFALGPSFRITRSQQGCAKAPRHSHAVSVVVVKAIVYALIALLFVFFVERVDDFLARFRAEHIFDDF